MAKVFFDIDGEEHCDEAAALAEMLAAGGLLFVGSEAGPFFEGDAEQCPASIWINCNDLFAWGCADAEPLPNHRVGAFYKAWKAGKYTKWCCVRRNLQPQAPMIQRMKERGEWDDELEALPKNPDSR